MRWALWFAALVLLVLSVWIGVTALDAGSQNSVLLLSVAIWLLWPTLALIFLLIVLAIIRQGWKTLGSLFGEVGAARLLSLGVVAILFSDTVRAVFRPFIVLLYDLSVGVPSKIQGSLRFVFGNECQSPEDLRICARSLYDAFVSILTTPLQRAIDSLTSINFAVVIVALAVWVCLGQVLSATMRKDSQGRSDATPWLQLLEHARKVQSATWINGLLFALIGFGVLLSISALIAIPVLSEAKPLSEAEMNSQAASLDAIVKMDELRVAIIPSELPKDDGLVQRYADLEKRIDALANKLATAKPAAAAAQPGEESRASADSTVVAPSGESIPGSIAMSPQTGISILNNAKDSLEEVQRSVPEDWKRFSQDLLTSAESSRQYALSTLQRQNLAPGGVQGSNIADLRSWLADTITAIRRTAASCRAAAHDKLEQSANFISAQIDWVQRGIGSGFTLPPVAANVGLFERCAVYSSREAPAVTSLSLGAFGFSAWLINLNSMPLTLIAGMLGFGLVGAAVSSVIRERSKRQEGEPLVKDLPGIMVRGLSATIVVYLAVKSGLLIFTGGSTSQADPHVLLLTCFIASVFSEDVWDAARTRFVEKLRGGGRGGNVAAQGPPTNTPAHPPGTGD